MPTLDTIAPKLSANVLMRTLDDEGHSIAKHKKRHTYLNLGPQEAFLLQRLDGESTYGAIAESFEEKFDEPLTSDDVHGFIKMAESERLLEKNDGEEEVEPAPQGFESIPAFFKRVVVQAKKQSPMYFRISLFNPDRLLNWLEPRTRWLFSWQLGLASIICGVAAVAVSWANRDDIVTNLSINMSWETLAIAWLTAVVVTICHEFGHGLACKRYGGEVREMGALWIFFTPCLFCNVSDAWLLKSRWQRLWISLAGTYIDYLVWILAVFIWRVTSPDAWMNYVAWIIVTTCGIRVMFNVNPLMRLDGYYALTDLLGVHNLRRRSRELWLSHVRWVMWGGKRPTVTGRAWLWLIYGAVTWTFTVVFLGFFSFHLGSWLNGMMGFVGFAAAVGLYIKLSKRYYKGSLGDDFMKMFDKKKKRVVVWGSLCLVLLAIPMYDRAGGTFQVRPVVRSEVRAPIAGFLREVRYEEGDRVEAGSVIGLIEVPELESEIRRKEAEIKESEAKLRQLKAGNRPEVIAEQKQKIARAAEWRDLAVNDLDHARLAFQEEIARLEMLIAQAQSELDYRNSVFTQAQQLHQKGGLAGQQLLMHKNRVAEAQSALFQAQAQKRSRVAEGNLKYEGELARREKELADTKAALTLLEAGSRPEEIEAETASLNRLKEELRHLNEQAGEQVVRCTVSGTLSTPHLNEKIGQYMDRGALICVVEDLSQMEAEIAVSEQQARSLVPGQFVTLKPRALPFCRLTGKVDRIAPAAMCQQTLGKPVSSESSVVVYCQVENQGGALRTGMTGFGRIDASMRPFGLIALTRGLAFLRTEFWW